MTQDRSSRLAIPATRSPVEFGVSEFDVAAPGRSHAATDGDPALGPRARVGHDLPLPCVTLVQSQSPQRIYAVLTWLYGYGYMAI